MPEGCVTPYHLARWDNQALREHPVAVRKTLEELYRRLAQPPIDARALLMLAYDEIPESSALRRRIMDAVAPLEVVTPQDIEWAQTVLTSSAPEPKASQMRDMLGRCRDATIPHALRYDIDKLLNETPTQPLPTSPKYKIGDRVEWTNFLKHTFTGSILGVDVESHYVVQFSDGTAAHLSESELRPFSTKEA